MLLLFYFELLVWVSSVTVNGTGYARLRHATHDYDTCPSSLLLHARDLWYPGTKAACSHCPRPERKGSPYSLWFNHDTWRCFLLPVPLIVTNKSLDSIITANKIKGNLRTKPSISRFILYRLPVGERPAFLDKACFEKGSSFKKRNAQNCTFTFYA